MNNTQKIENGVVTFESGATALVNVCPSVQVPVFMEGKLTTEKIYFLYRDRNFRTAQKAADAEFAKLWENLQKEVRKLQWLPHFAWVSMEPANKAAEKGHFRTAVLKGLPALKKIKAEYITA